MTDRTARPGSNDDDLSPDQAGSEADREAALTMELLRRQERHREGGVDTNLVLGPGDAAEDESAGAPG